MPFLARHKKSGQLVTIFSAAPAQNVYKDLVNLSTFLVVENGKWSWLPQKDFEPLAAWASGETTSELRLK